jgi:hypothetical protein
LWFAGGLVGAGCVEGKGAEDFARGGVDDADVEVFDEADNFIYQNTVGTWTDVDAE